jgi:hypothetical protein
MSIIPASRLSSSDLAILGNNFMPSRRASRTPRTRDETASRQVLAAVQRSLASVGESITELYPAGAPVGGALEC